MPPSLICAATALPLAITLWDSLAAVRAFTGENGQQPPLPADDARFLIGAAAVVHYQTIDPPG
jgi:hypothetical protein